MEWYYAVDGQRKGPVSKKEIEDMVRSKQITLETLVWKEGMENWQELGVVAGRKKPSETPERMPPPPEDLPSEESGLELKQKPDMVPDELTVSCAECGSIFPEDETILYEGSRICAACKPRFMQKLREGLGVSGQMVYGGFWIRFGAKIIDYIALWIVNMILMIPAGMMMGSGISESGEMMMGVFGIQLLVQMTVPIIYNTWFIGKYAATPGKMACKLKVVVSDGGKVSFARALGRTFAEWLSGIILGIGYIMAAFDDEKRTLHDRICDTRVIRK